MNRIKTFLTIAALSSLSAMAEQVPGSCTDFDVSFKIEDGNPSVSGSFNAPKLTKGGTELTENIALIEVTRSSYIAGEQDFPVLEMRNVAPGTFIEFTDDEEHERYGIEYNYEVRAYNSARQGGYGSSKYLYVGLKPAVPEAVLIPDGDDFTKITVTITTPSTTEAGEKLPLKLTRLTLTDYVNPSKEFELFSVADPEEGIQYEFTTTLPAAEQKFFRVYAECSYGKSDHKPLRYYSGKDVPSAPTNLTASENASGGVNLNWEGPDCGMRDGIFNPSETLYKVERLMAGNSSKVLADAHSTTNFVDDLSDLEKISEIMYRVTAFNGEGEGEKVELKDPITVGPAATLPFEETFNTGGYYKEPDNVWGYEWSDNDTSANWYFDKFDYSNWITGAGAVGDEDEGYAYISISFFSNGDRIHSLVSPKIDFSNAEYPVMTYYTASVYGNPKEMEILGRADGAGEDYSFVRFNPADEMTEESDIEWIQRTQPLELLAGTKASVIFKVYAEATAEGHEDIFLDEIRIDDYKPVGNIHVETGENRTLLYWRAPSCSDGAADSYLVTINDDEPVRVYEPEFDFATEAGKEYIVRVRSCYGDIESRDTDPTFFKGGEQTAVTTISADGLFAEWFDLNGNRILSPGKGQILIRRTIDAQGNVKMEKIVR